MVRIVLLFLVLISGIAHAKMPEAKVNISSTTVWQRQQVILTVEVKTHDEFARLEAEYFELSDFDIFPLERIHSNIKTTNESIKVGWIIFPLVSGEHRIELPKISYRPSSGSKKTLKLQPLLLNVKTLPSYVPPTMPVGHVALSNQLQGGKLGWLHNTKTLTRWDIRVHTKGVLPQTAPAILRDIITSNSLEVLPETQKQTLKKTYQGLEKVSDYQLPIKALSNGKIKLPLLSIQYFDPQDNKLNRITSKASNHWALSIPLQILFVGMIFSIFMYSLFKLFQSIYKHRQKQKRFKASLRMIQQANNPHELHTALNFLSHAQGWKSNITLEDFSQHWQSKFGLNQKLNLVISDLQSFQFEKSKNDDFNQIKLALLTIIKRS